MKPAILFDKLYLPVENMPEDLIINLRDMLTLSNPVYETTLKYSPYGKVGKDIPKELKFYDDSNPELFAIPRGTDLEVLPKEHQDLIRNMPVKDKRLSFRQKMPELPYETLNETQHEVLDTIMEGFQDPYKHGACLAVLPVSSGKTRISLYAAQKLQQRTLILCDTSLIAQGWENEIRLIFNWKTPKKKRKSRKQPRYSNKKLPNIGLVKQDKAVLGRYFTIVSWQTVNRRGMEFWDWLSKHHGFMIVDEAEVCPSKTFIQFVTHFAGRNKLAITGTDYRKDGLEKALFFEFGNPYIKKVSTNVETEVSLPIEDVITIQTTRKYSWSKGDFDHNHYENEIGRSRSRRALICDTVEEEYKKGSYCLIVTEQTDHAKRLYRDLVARGHTDDIVLVMSGVDKAAADKMLAGEYRIVVATVKYIFKGANSPRLDRLFLASLTKDDRTLNQLFGRVRRKAPGKKNVLVYEFNDPGGGPIKKNQVARNNVYAAMGIKRFKDIIYI